MTKPEEFQFFRRGGEFFLIAGPCVLENDELHEEIADVLWQVRRWFSMPVLFKASYDKANRSRPEAPRGPGLIDGLEMLSWVRRTTQLPVLTDVHEPHHAELAAIVCDALQVPAFLCRQTDLLLAVWQTGLPVNLKKGQWVGIPEMDGAVAKVTQGLPNYPVAVTERGTFFGYGDLVVDMRNIQRLHAALDVPVIFDGTHSVQRPGLGKHGASGGARVEVRSLVLAAVAAGADGLFLEVHPRPDDAPSDAASMLPLEQLLPLMEEVMEVRRAVRSHV
jgi:2-dehydro-3-deoxyphosphooctonate aldolase (KDO 8-P synthase)